MSCSKPMLKPQVHYHQQDSQLAIARRPFLCNIPKQFNIHGSLDYNQYASSSSFPPHHSILSRIYKSLLLKNVSTKAIAGGTVDQALAEEYVKVKATVTVTQTIGGLLSSIGIERGLDDLNDLLGKSLLLELVSADLNPKTGLEKETIKGFAHRRSKNGKDITYECEFQVTEEFGEVGAVFLENEHHKEMYIKEIVLDGLPNGRVNITCDSWIHSKFDNPQKRVFFSNKSYLPSQTPNGLKRLREEELFTLRGDGQGERKKGDRIYDYDVYNDIGDPDKGETKARPVVGGKERPYPRRCRTGRPRCEKDPSAEKRSSTFYVPRDEAFAEIKQLTFSAKTLYSGLHALVPSLETIVDSNLGFPLFSNIDSLFNEGIHLPPLQEQKKGLWGKVMPRLVKAVTGGSDLFLCFETPETMIRDRFFWFRDVEFARQTLAGLNPYSIQLVKEWPLRSKLDPDIYGPPESAITTGLIEREIKGFMTVDKAIQQKKLFIIDYHDILLPFVSRVRELEGTTLYGSRALFFLTPDGTLKPLAIELTRPPMDGKPQWKRVFTPAWHSTGCWLWRLAKVHFLAHDAGYHQLVSHWLRTHCATEPYIIATNRQLSEMHPIYRLLHPHFRYTMEINSLARQALINVDGIIETSFSLGKYSMEISSAAYDQQWRFDCESLPKDLIQRGLAVEDLTAPHGLSLTIEDYPFANDGLLIWDAIKTWVSDYVKHYYPNSSSIASDAEIQAWWTEIRTVGHADKKDEPWWPKLDTRHDLIEILTTMIWVTSGHHASVNFGQYAYAGYFPNRPTIARINMPNEDPTNEQWKAFMNKPAMQLLKTFPSRVQATKVMAVLDILSTHSPDEEYLGEYMEKSWGEDPIINAAFEKFNGRLRQIEGIIDERNANEDLNNRHGAGVVPYELLKPFSEPGVTGKGVPYSISI